MTAEEIRCWDVTYGRKVKLWCRKCNIVNKLVPFPYFADRSETCYDAETSDQCCHILVIHDLILQWPEHLQNDHASNDYENTHPKLPYCLPFIFCKNIDVHYSLTCT